MDRRRFLLGAGVTAVATSLYHPPALATINQQADPIEDYETRGLVYTATEGSFVDLVVDERHGRRRTSGPTIDRQPVRVRRSDADQIVFVRHTLDDRWFLCTLDLTTSVIEALEPTLTFLSLQDPAVSWRGQTAVYTMGDDLWLYDFGQRKSSPLTADASNSDAQASWRFDDTALSFVRYAEANPANGLRSSDIFILNLADGMQDRLTGSGQASEASWSPTEERLAYVEGDLVKVLEADGIGHVLGRGAHPVWSPDGRFVAFSKNSSLLVATPSGEDVRIVARDLPGRVGAATWSQDASSLAFTVSRLAVPTVTLVSDLFEVRSDGNDLRLIVSGPVSEPLYSGRIS